jgi:hypothetical protein
VLLYQWYVNDIEVIADRPNETRIWHRWSGHERLRRTSFLYYFLDHRVNALLPAPDRSYVDYLLQDFHLGTAEWSEFERYFHAFAVRAAEVARRRVLLMYPQVPFRGEYPLRALHDLMKTIAAPHILTIPPAAWITSAGHIEADTAAPWSLALRVPREPTATCVENTRVLAHIRKGERAGDRART